MALYYLPKETINIFAEIYGQSQTSPKLRWGWNSDIGILFLLNPSMVLDLEVGQRLYGRLDGFERYIGAGISFMLG